MVGDRRSPASEPTRLTEWDALLAEEKTARLHCWNEGEPQKLTKSARVEGLTRWWRALDLVLSRCAGDVGLGQEVPSEAWEPIMVAAKIARECAIGRIPEVITDRMTPGRTRTASEEQDVDWAKAYLLACSKEGFKSANYTARINDSRSNKTIAKKYNVSVETVKKWKRRPLSRPIPVAEDMNEIGLSELIKSQVDDAGARYSIHGTGWNRPNLSR